jgi:formylglycine-generating enzyme
MRALWMWFFLLPSLVASPASAVAMAWTSIAPRFGDPPNSCDPQSQGCFGAVPYAYQIGTYEVTNAQYAEFLNAKGALDPLQLYNPSMGDPTGYGGIERNGDYGSYTYTAVAGRENMPVNLVSFIDALRFANWMNNGQGTGDTETGAYTLYDGYFAPYGVPSNARTVTRNSGATIVLASEDEWYKAAYYSVSLDHYFDYPTRSDFPTMCTTPSSSSRRANCGNAVGDLTPVGSYPGSPSQLRSNAFGTFDQGGNVAEWTEAIVTPGATRAFRGGSFDDPFHGPDDPAGTLGADMRFELPPDAEWDRLGFRLVLLPEPGTGLLLIAGLVGFAAWRRPRT